MHSRLCGRADRSAAVACFKPSLPRRCRHPVCCSVDLPEGRARGYVLEIFASHFTLPDLGPIGGWVAEEGFDMPGGGVAAAVEQAAGRV